MCALSRGSVFRDPLTSAPTHPLKVETRVRTPLGLPGIPSGASGLALFAWGRPTMEEEVPGSVCGRIPSELVQFGHELLRAMKHLPDPERAPVGEVAHDGPFVRARVLGIQRCRFGTRQVIDEED